MPRSRCGAQPDPSRPRVRREMSSALAEVVLDSCPCRSGGRHLILKGVIGNPKERLVELRAHEEGCADLVAILSSLHLNEVVDCLLERTQGRLYASSVVTRIGESVVDRNAYNNFTISDVPWDPNPDSYKYALCLRFEGAVFDLLVELYERRLVARGMIARGIAEHSTHTRGRAVPSSGVSRGTSRCKPNRQREESARRHGGRRLFGSCA